MHMYIESVVRALLDVLVYESPQQACEARKIISKSDRVIFFLLFLSVCTQWRIQDMEFWWKLWRFHNYEIWFYWYINILFKVFLQLVSGGLPNVQLIRSGCLVVVRACSWFFLLVCLWTIRIWSCAKKIGLCDKIHFMLNFCFKCVLSVHMKYIFWSL